MTTLLKVYSDGEGAWHMLTHNGQWPSAPSCICFQAIVVAVCLSVCLSVGLYTTDANLTAGHFPTVQI